MNAKSWGWMVQMIFPFSVVGDFLGSKAFTVIFQGCTPENSHIPPLEKENHLQECL